LAGDPLGTDHTGIDALKAVMAGAHAVQMVSAVIKNGPGYLAVVLKDLERWLEAHHYEALRKVQGRMSLQQSQNPQAVERGNYLRVLQAWHLTGLGR
jgi:dihydroorotate dehydrogenase (fumarate)